jgi:hypothetical protein
VVGHSARDAWAVGSTSAGVEGPLRGLILHWNGTAWKMVSAVGGGAGANLLGVSATGQANVWAVGLTEDGSRLQTLALHWQGRSWARVTSPVGQPGHGRSLDAVAATSGGNVWAVGTDVPDQGPQQAIVLHRNGSTWIPVTHLGSAPGGDSELAGVAAGSPRNVWAVGNTSMGTGASQAFIFHCC